MKKTLVCCAILALIAFVTAGPAVAGGPSCKEALMKATADAKVTLNQAIETAEKDVPGGKVTEAKLKAHADPIFYRVELMVGDTFKEVRVDALNGKILGTENVKMDQKEKTELADFKKALGEVKTTYTQAIENAEKERKGSKVIGIELMTGKGNNGYEVHLLQGDKCFLAEIDGTNGKVARTEEKPLPLAMWTFEKDPVGKTPPDLKPEETHPGMKAGEWTVTADPSLPGKEHVLRLTSTEGKDTFNLAVFDKTSYKDVDLAVRMRADSGKEDQGGGLAWRVKDANNYYVCRVNPLEKNCRVYKVVNGKRDQLASAEANIGTGEWYKLRVVAEGDRITCYLNGQKCLSAKDDTFKDAGMIGLWTKADASSTFEHVALFSPTATEQERKAEARRHGENIAGKEEMEEGE
jgi:uncharacterized membrane protein YkoI